MTIEKEVTAYVVLKDDQVARFTDEEDGALDTESLAAEPRFVDEANQAIRSEAYKATICSGGHGWRHVHTSNVDVEFSVSSLAGGQTA
ncbi:hypothetical protein D3C78_1735210 [compost metagenome]